MQVFVEACDMSTVFLVLVLGLFHAGRVLCHFSILRYYLVHLIRGPCLEPFFYF